MNLDRVIAVRNTKTIYRDGDKCIKVFNQDYTSADVLNEAFNQAMAAESGLSVPRIKEVSEHDGKWAITSEYIIGKSLSQLMDEFWGYDASATSRTVDVYMAKLREKTAACSGFEIVTVHGLGYKAVLK